MKKWIAGTFITAFILCLCNGCANPAVDYDLTQMDESLLCPLICGINYYADDFAGKTMIITGESNESYSEVTGKTYHYISVNSSGDCDCAEYLEYFLEDENYPAAGTNITVKGTFNLYSESIICEEDGEEEYWYCALMNAKIVN